MDNKDRLLLMHLQTGLDLESRPFETLAQKIDCDVVEVFLRIQHLKEEKNIRQISGVLDLRKLGYQNTLVAMKLAATQHANAVSFLSKHPGISFIFDSRNEFNLWFNLALPRGFALDEHINYLQRAVHAEKTLLLPVVKRFRVDRPASKMGLYPPSIRDEWGAEETTSYVLSEGEMGILRCLQADLPLTDQPFMRYAKQLEMGETQFLELARELMDKGVLKRIGALPYLRPERTKVNALIMWQVPGEREVEMGYQISLFPEIQSCAKRPPSDKFPYSLYAMVNASGLEEANEIAQRIEERCGKWPRHILCIDKEYKRARLEYFSKDLDTWTKRAKTLQSF